MSSLWFQGVADLVIVVVKPRADEGNGDMHEDKTRGKRQKCQRQRTRHINEMRLDAWTTIAMRLENEYLTLEGASYKHTNKE